MGSYVARNQASANCSFSCATCCVACEVFGVTTTLCGTGCAVTTVGSGAGVAVGGGGATGPGEGVATGRAIAGVGKAGNGAATLLNVNVECCVVVVVAGVETVDGCVVVAVVDVPLVTVSTTRIRMQAFGP